MEKSTGNLFNFNIRCFQFEICCAPPTPLNLSLEQKRTKKAQIQLMFEEIAMRLPENNYCEMSARAFENIPKNSLAASYRKEKLFENNANRNNGKIFPVSDYQFIA